MTQTGRKASVSDRTLSWLLRGGIIILVVGIPLFGVLYFLDQRSPGGPSLSQRQIQTAEVAVRATPNNVALRLTLAATYREAKRYDDAIKQYDEILKADKNNQAALLGRGTVLLAQGKIDRAAADLRLVTKMNPSGEFAGADPQLQEAHYFLASIYVKQGNSKDATTELLAALKIDKTDADAWYLLGTVQLKDGATDKAIESLRSALMFVPTGWCEPYASLTEAYQKANQAPQAEYAGAMLDFCKKKPADATRRLKTLTSGPVALDATLGLGMVAESTDRRDEAIDWYRKALAIDPRNNTAKSALSRLGAPAPSGAAPAPTGSPTAKTS